LADLAFEEALMTRSPRPAALPGDQTLNTAAMVRVDHAGEYGAARIYAGQLAILGQRHSESATIRHMAAQEERHLKSFDTLITARRVRPTMLGPFWHVAGYALGAATALMGPKAAMACTAAVETVIDDHYAAQMVALGNSDPELSTLIADFQADEQQHRQTALDHGAEEAVAYPLMSRAIQAGCRMAIRLSEKI
jgi:3-demethoxyubiquinol 3-hydroxylase